MPTIAQIRAARALLDWSQSDLADHADLSQTGVARIENGTNKPNSTTVEKINAAFDSHDIEFISDSGVKKRTGEIKILKGTEGFRSFMDDVYKQASTKGGDICLFNGMPEYFKKWLGEEWYSMHAARMVESQDNFTCKIIVKEGEKLLIGNSFAEYRTFPDNLFHERTFYAYGNRLAFLSLDDDNVKIRILEQSEFSNSFKVLFNIAWDTIAQSIE